MRTPIEPKSVTVVRKMETCPALPGEPGISENHVHEWHPDPIIGPTEEICRCGLWRCAQIDGRNGQRCLHAAIDIWGYCKAHQRPHGQPNAIAGHLAAAGDWLDAM